MGWVEYTRRNPKQCANIAKWKEKCFTMFVRFRNSLSYTICIFILLQAFWNHSFNGSSWYKLIAYMNASQIKSETQNWMRSDKILSVEKCMEIVVSPDITLNALDSLVWRLAFGVWRSFFINMMILYVHWNSSFHYYEIHRFLHYVYRKLLLILGVGYRVLATFFIRL